MVDIKEKISGTLNNVKSYWKVPPKGRYMSFREIVSLSVGGMGIKFVVFCVQNMILSVGNTLIGNTIGIPPKPLYTIYIISVILSLPLMTLRAQIIDCAHHKKGKYRPYVLLMGLPSAILAVGFTLMPYDRMTMFGKCATVLIFNVGFQFFYQFYYDVDQSIINVLSPNTIERSDVYSIKSVTDSLAPTIGNFIVPLLARLITGENTLVDMRIYRAVYPPMIIAGFLLGLLMYFNTEEKIVQAKTHTVKIKFTDALRAVMKNKYFWIISLAGWIGFLEAAVQNVMDWLYSYQDACSAMEYSIIVAIRGNASFWPMLFLPFLIRSMGKKKLLVFSNIINVIFIIVMLPIVQKGNLENIIWLLLLCFFFNYMGSTVGLLLTPSVNGDIRDYQQYITGERIDGMFVAVGVIGSVITLITNSVLPEIYDRAGLNETVAKSLGFDGSNVYDVLHDEMYFRSICSVLIIASAIGAALNVIPYFFYDLSELKQKAMVTVLKVRAMFEDYGNDALSPQALIEGVEIVEEAKKYFNETPVEISKSKLKQAKKTHNKELIKQAKQKYRQDVETNEKIAVAQYVVKEINKFSAPAAIKETEQAQIIKQNGIQALKDYQYNIKNARKLPDSTEEEKEIRTKAIEKEKAVKQSIKYINKYYKNGIEEFDAEIFNTLFAKEDRISDEIDSLYKEINSGKSGEDKNKMKERIRILKSEKKAVKKNIKKATNQNSIYAIAAKPYLDAEKFLIQRENYLHYDEIKLKYETAVRSNINE